MLSPSPAVRVFLAIEPVDMRGGQNSLSGVVRRLGLDPLDGHVYVCMNRNRFMVALRDRSAKAGGSRRCRPIGGW